LSIINFVSDTVRSLDNFGMFFSVPFLYHTSIFKS
jgi:hypothetical protein